MNGERIQKNVLEIKVKKKIPQRETDEHGSSRVGEISQRMKEEHEKEAARPWLECGVVDEVMLTHRERCYYSFRKK
jgi:hypothetical protein